MEKVQKMLPEGVSVEPYLNRSELVNRNISTVIKNLIEGAIIVFLVLIIFLGNVRAGLIVASVIPLAMLFGFIMMRIFGVSANLMSLGAIDFGIVVDGSIVILEGILAHIYGKNMMGRTFTKEEMDAELGAEFIPTLDEGDFAMQMTLPAGSSLSRSIQVSLEAEKILKEKFPEIKHVVAKIGTAEVPTDPMAVEDADIMIVMKPFSEWTSAKSRDEMVEKMKASLESIEDVDFNFSQPIQLRFNELMTCAKADIAIKLYGEDMEELYSKAKEAARYVEQIPGAS